jgi:Dehydratase large subunit/Dehydratase medium subunit
VTSGYSVMPRYDNVFGGGNYDADDLDEWLTLQRDWQVDAGIEPLSEEDALRVRERAARAIQSVFAAFHFPPVSEEEVTLAAEGYDSRDLPDRDRAADVAAADRVLEEGISGLDVARALDSAGFTDVAEAIMGLQRLRVTADYLQTSAIVGLEFEVESAVNSPNDYTGPGTGYRLDGERWARLQELPHQLDPDVLAASEESGGPSLVAHGEARTGGEADEVVVALGPAFLAGLRETINGLPHEAVLAALADGIRAGGARPRIVGIRRSSDVAFIGHDGSLLSGSAIAVGLQSKGTAVIHRADLEPLDNLELFGMAPLLTLDSYRAIGRNAAAYALGLRTSPVPVEIDNYARAKLIVKTTLMHAAETGAIDPDAPPVDLSLELASPRSGRASR